MKLLKFQTQSQKGGLFSFRLFRTLMTNDFLTSATNRFFLKIDVFFKQLPAPSIVGLNNEILKIICLLLAGNPFEISYTIFKVRKKKLSKL